MLKRSAGPPDRAAMLTVPATLVRPVGAVILTAAVDTALDTFPVDNTIRPRPIKADRFLRTVYVVAMVFPPLASPWPNPWAQYFVRTLRYQG
jgi:hypothetical protein